MLSERIYSFRRRSGLSQEQLAEKIGVSRQSVSKWESGAATPELEKLLALSECFGVPLDALVKEEAVGRETKEALPQAGEGRAPKAMEMKAGIGLCLAGAVCLLLFGALMLVDPGAAEQLDAASMITLRGSGVIFLLCLLSMAAGLVLILRKK